MRKIYVLFLSCTLISIVTHAQYVVIPDGGFRNFLMTNFPSCFDDGTGRLNTTCSAVLTEDTLSIPNLNIQDLTGIQYFPSLKYLDCSGDPLPATTVFPNSLTYLNCSGSFFQDDGPLYSTPYTALPAYFPPYLTYLDLSANGVMDGNSNISLPSTLTYLNVSGDVGVPFLPLPNLTYLDCSDEVDFTLEPGPRVLYSLPTLPSKLKTLKCGGNAISSLPALPDSLTYLDCSDMEIGNNNDGSPNSLVPSLFCLPILPKTLTTLICDNTISCLPNFVPGLQSISQLTISSEGDETVAFVSLPVCNPTNDVNHCLGFPIISGNIFYDNNSNGIKDTNEIYASNINVQLSNGTNTTHSFTSTLGNYSIAPDSIGNYTLTVNIPSYYQAVPNPVNYGFDRYDTSISQQNIALQPIASVDSLRINITPLYTTARPGRRFPYLITYTNIGTTTLSPNIIIGYKNILLDYDSSSNSSVINNGTNLSLIAANIQPGQTNSFIAYFTLDSADLAGEVLFVNAEIIANAALATDSINSVIKSSYDPNDKEATPMLTPYEVNLGKAITYTIHFQNTGNALADNIVVADTLSSLLDTGSVQVINSSNACNVTINGNVLYFEFLNILLPDSNDDEPASHGFVSFTVKPQSFVNNGSIDNSASIYFDYNSPVLTNTASTLIQDSNSIVRVTLLSFYGLTQPGSNNTLLYWRTANELNTKSFEIEQSTDDINFTPLATVPAKGSGGNSYSYSTTQNAPIVYYRLIMIDNDGEYTYSNIISVKNGQNAESTITINNPVENSIYIKTNEATLNNTIAKIFNSQGALVKSFLLFKGTQAIDVSMLPSGAYYIQTQLTSLKMIISR